MNKKESILDKLFDEIQETDDFKLAEYKMLLSQKIDEGIKAKGWNKSKFASEMNKKPSVITRWLSGTYNFTSDTLYLIEIKLGIKLLNLEIETEQASKGATITASIKSNISYSGSFYINSSDISKTTHSHC